METLLAVVVVKAVIATLLAIVAALAARFVRRPGLVHSLWLVVLLELMGPPLLRVGILPSLSDGPSRSEATASHFRDPDAGILAPSPAAGAPPESYRSRAAEGRDVDGPGPTEDGRGRASARAASPSSIPASPGAKKGTDRTQGTTLRRGAGDVGSRAPLDRAWTRGVDATSLKMVPPLSVPVGTSPGPARSALALVRARVVAVLSLVWGAGAGIVLILAAVRWRRFRRQIAEAPGRSGDLQARAQRLCVRMGLARCPEVRVVRSRIAPMVGWRLGRLEVLFPEALADRLAEPERDALLAHELAHVQRRDHLIRFLELGAASAFWWHPVSWWARRGLRRAEERACDERVIEAMPWLAPSYARAMIETVEFLAGAGALRAPVLVSGLDEFTNLKERLTMILGDTEISRPSRLQRWSLAAGAAALILSFPTWAERTSARAPHDGEAPAPAAAPAAPSARAADALAPIAAPAMPEASAPRAASATAASAAPRAARAPRASTTPAAPLAPEAAATPVAPLAPSAASTPGTALAPSTAAAPATALAPSAAATPGAATAPSARTAPRAWAVPSAATAPSATTPPSAPQPASAPSPAPAPRARPAAPATPLAPAAPPAPGRASAMTNLSASRLALPQAPQARGSSDGSTVAQDEPARASDDPARASDRPARASEDPARASDDPVRAGDDPARASDDDDDADADTDRVDETPATGDGAGDPALEERRAERARERAGPGGRRPRGPQAAYEEALRSLRSRSADLERQLRELQAMQRDLERKIARAQGEVRENSMRRGGDAARESALEAERALRGAQIRDQQEHAERALAEAGEQIERELGERSGRARMEADAEVREQIARELGERSGRERMESEVQARAQRDEERQRLVRSELEREIAAQRRGGHEAREHIEQALAELEKQLERSRRQSGAGSEATADLERRLEALRYRLLAEGDGRSRGASRAAMDREIAELHRALALQQKNMKKGDSDRAVRELRERLQELEGVTQGDGGVE